MSSSSVSTKPRVFRCVMDGASAILRFARGRPLQFGWLVLVALAERLVGEYAATPILVFAIAVAVMVLQSAPLVTIHRGILLGHDREALTIARVLRYSAVGIALLLVVLLPGVLAQLAVMTGAGSGAATIAAVLAVGGIVASVRASLALPHAAIDGERPLRTSLDLIRGSAWRIFAIMFLPMLLLLVPFGLEAAAPEPMRPLVDLTAALFSAFSVALVAAALSHAYRVLAQAAGRPL